MEDLSEQAIKANCPHCDLTSQAFTYLLERTKHFHIVCDGNPIIEGHILIIPKKHLSCIGAYPQDVFNEYLKLHKKVSQFVKEVYGSVSSFEHGIFGQTVFHSHIHFLPFSGSSLTIIPEGEKKLAKMQNFLELKNLLQKDNGYLFFSIGDNKWVVDVKIAAPRFFRDRFAKALGRPERGNWKKMRINEEIKTEAHREAVDTQSKWKEWNILVRTNIS